MSNFSCWEKSGTRETIFYNVIENSTHSLQKPSLDAELWKRSKLTKEGPVDEQVYSLTMSHSLTWLCCPIKFFSNACQWKLDFSHQIWFRCFLMQIIRKKWNVLKWWSFENDPCLKSWQISNQDIHSTLNGTLFLEKFFWQSNDLNAYYIDIICNSTSSNKRSWGRCNK